MQDEEARGEDGGGDERRGCESEEEGAAAVGEVRVAAGLFEGQRVHIGSLQSRVAIEGGAA